MILKKIDKENFENSIRYLTENNINDPRSELISDKIIKKTRSGKKY